MRSVDSASGSIGNDADAGVERRRVRRARAGRPASPSATNASTSAMPRSTRIAPSVEPLGALDLIEVARLLVVDRRPRQLRRSRPAPILAGPGSSLDAPGHVGLEAVLLEHAARDLEQVEVMAGSHRSKRYPNKKHDVLDRGDLQRIQKQAVDAARERTVEGHLSASHKPEVTRRHSGAVVHVDDALRDPEPMRTEDQKLLDSAHMSCSRPSPARGGRSSAANGARCGRCGFRRLDHCLHREPAAHGLCRLLRRRGVRPARRARCRDRGLLAGTAAPPRAQPPRCGLGRRGLGRRVVRLLPRRPPRQAPVSARPTAAGAGRGRSGLRCLGGGVLTPTSTASRTRGRGRGAPASAPSTTRIVLEGGRVLRVGAHLLPGTVASRIRTRGRAPSPPRAASSAPRRRSPCRDPRGTPCR